MVRQYKSPREPRGKFSKAELNKQAQARYRERNPDKFKTYYLANSDAIKEASDRNRYPLRYGITYKDRVRMHEERGGLCDICGKPNAGGELLFIDHDHETGEVRGMLCSACNSAIGFMRDLPELLRKAADYLERSA